MVQLSRPYMTTGKNIALTIQTFVGKVMSLLFNTLSRFVIGLPQWLSGKESTCNTESSGDLGSTPGREDPLKEGMATPVFLPGESHR